MNFAIDGGGDIAKVCFPFHLIFLLILILKARVVVGH